MVDKHRRATAACRCGQVAIEVSGAPIFSAICYCESCRTAGYALERAPGAPKIVDADGGASYCLFRKDRVAIIRGADLLQEHRLKQESPTRRVVATCCNSPVFLEFTNGHWLTLYRDRLPADAPSPDMRVMVRDRTTAVPLPDDIPTYATHPASFMIKLLTSWAAMGFRRPKLDW